MVFKIGIITFLNIILFHELKAQSVDSVICNRIEKYLNFREEYYKNSPNFEHKKYTYIFKIVEVDTNSNDLLYTLSYIINRDEFDKLNVIGYIDILGQKVAVISSSKINIEINLIKKIDNCAKEYFLSKYDPTKDSNYSTTFIYGKINLNTLEEKFNYCRNEYSIDRKYWIIGYNPEIDDLSKYNQVLYEYDSISRAWIKSRLLNSSEK
jgi:transposase